VAYVPGTAFYSGAARADGRRSMRLSYCYPEPDRIREGVRRLAAVIEQELDLVSTFGSNHGRLADAAVDVPTPDSA
jgi:2-aminoadipate transaminase